MNSLTFITNIFLIFQSFADDDSSLYSISGLISGRNTYIHFDTPKCNTTIFLHLDDAFFQPLEIAPENSKKPYPIRTFLRF